MRKTLVFGAMAALIGLVAAAQASDRTRATMRDEAHATHQQETDGRGEMTGRAADTEQTREAARETHHEAGERKDRD